MQKPNPMRVTLAAMMLAAAMTLAGCSTVEPRRVNLFESADYVRTLAGDVVAGRTTATNGVWFSDPAIERLQKADILP